MIIQILLLLSILFSANSFLKAVYIKIKHGDKVLFRYVPIAGHLTFLIYSMIKYKDPL